MVSLIEELEARETAARVRVEELEAAIAELTARLEGERETWSRLRVTREIVAAVLVEFSLDSKVRTDPNLRKKSRVKPYDTIGGLAVGASMFFRRHTNRGITGARTTLAAATLFRRGPSDLPTTRGQ